MIDKELSTILDQNMMVEDGEPRSLIAIANRIEGNQMVWDAEIKEIFRCLQDMDVKVKEIVRVLLNPSSSWPRITSIPQMENQLNNEGTYPVHGL
ncbi:MAG: hypothetical protein WBF33_34750 [Candidatus Nitrosopolaris sp.]|jgi:hypothetical protein